MTQPISIVWKTCFAKWSVWLLRACRGGRSTLPHTPKKILMLTNSFFIITVLKNFISSSEIMLSWKWKVYGVQIIALSVSSAGILPCAIISDECWYTVGASLLTVLWDCRGRCCDAVLCSPVTHESLYSYTEVQWCFSLTGVLTAALHTGHCSSKFSKTPSQPL